MRSTLLLPLILACAVATAAEAPVKDRGVEEIKDVQLMQTVPESCLSIAYGDVALLVSRKRLDALVRAQPEKWRTEPERQALIAGKRAEALLAAVRNEVDASGCEPVSVPVETDAAYLLLKEIEAGSVAVVDSRTGALLPRVVLRYWSFRCGDLCGSGDVQVRTVDGHELFSLRLWSS